MLSLQERYDHYAERFRNLWYRRHTIDPYEGPLSVIVKFCLRRMKEYRKRMQLGEE